MKKVNRILWGVILVAAGALFALNALEITHFDLFFDGWWSLFIIVPCVVGLFTERDKTGNLIGIVLGVFLLLCAQEILDFSLLWKLAVPLIIVIIGIKMIITGVSGNKAKELLTVVKKSGGEAKACCAIFSGQDVNYGGEVFEGAELTAVFGGVECDLRSAIIEKDCAIQATAVFGGVDLLVPENVNVKAKCVSIFGGASNKRPAIKDAPTIYISGTCVFGGIEVK